MNPIRIAENAAARARADALAMALTPDEREQLSELEDHINPLSTWPPKMAEAMLSPHLKYSNRLALTFFVLGNGLVPTVYAKWLITRKMLKDDSARNHIANMIKEHMTGELEKKGVTTYMMDATTISGHPAPYAMRIQVIQTPMFAFDWEHQVFWETAINILKHPDRYFSPIGVYLGLNEPPSPPPPISELFPGAYEKCIEILSPP